MAWMKNTNKETTHASIHIQAPMVTSTAVISTFSMVWNH